MTNSAPSCSDDQLEVLLHSDERAVEFRSAAEHLESCSSCQARLAELAADGNEWAEARLSLQVDEADVQIEREEEHRSWSTSGQRRPPKTWSDSMTSQLLSPPLHPEMLGRLGRYEIERMIGSGGMGVVFKAFDSELNRPVAIKVLAPHLAGSGAARKRFSREARAAAAIVHEHVVAIHNVESEHEPPFLVMQYVAGESLQARLDREGPLNLCEILRIARQTAAGLAAAHEQGLVHRDVKPSNVLLEKGIDRALLTDFGLARASDDASLTHSGHVPGTPHYMSPEQARGESADQRSDLFSLGSLIYAMCTGRSPFRAETSFGVLRRITDAQPRSIREVNSEIPSWLCCITDKLHAKSPDERYQSAAEIAELLGQCLAHVQQPESQPLPTCVAKLAQSSNEGRYARDGLLPRSRSVVMSLVSVALIFFLVVASVIIVQQRRIGGSAIGSSKGPSGPPEASRNTPNIADDSDPSTGWESTESGVRRLAQEVDEFTSRADLLWDDLPVTTETHAELTRLSADESSD